MNREQSQQDQVDANSRESLSDDPFKYSENDSYQDLTNENDY